MSAWDCTDCKDTGEYRLDTERFDRLCNCSAGQALRKKWQEYDADQRARYKAAREFADDMMTLADDEDDEWGPNAVHRFYHDDRPRQWWMTDTVWQHIEKERAR